MKKGLLVLVVSLVLVVLVGCSTQQAAAPATAQPEQTKESAPAADSIPTSTPEVIATDAVKTGGTLTIGIGGVKQFDPVFIADDFSFQVASNVFSNLFRVYNNEVIPDLATSWEYKDDTTVVFNLRKDAFWHEGNSVFAEGKSRAVNADDVVYSIKRAIETKGASTPPDLLSTFDSVKAIDENTVELKLKSPDVMLFTNARGLSYVPIVPKEAVEKLGDQFGQSPVGSGPFKFVSYTPDDKIVLERNEKYWIKPNLEKVIYKIIPDDNVAMVALENGEIDVYNGPVPVNEVKRLSEDQKFTMGRQSCPVMTQIMFNMKNPLYSDIRFRQAVAYALDGDAINGNIFGMSAVSGAGTAGPEVPGYDEKLRDLYFKYDPEKAKTLMQELGYELKDGVYQKDGKTLEVPFEIYNWASIPRFGEAVASQLTAFGIKTNLETVEMGKYMEDWSAGVDKMMIMSGWCGEGGTYNLWGSNGFARPLGYEDQEVFKGLDDANITVDSAKHDELIRQAANKIYGQYWAVPMGFYQPFVASRSYVKEHTTAMWFDNLVTEKNNVWLDK